MYPIAYEAKYVNGYGPVNVKIIDPLKVTTGKYILKFDSLYLKKNFNITGNTALVAGGDTASYYTGTWHLEDESTGKVYPSDARLDQQNEQIFLDLGISVNMKSIYYPGPKQVGNIIDPGPPPGFIAIYTILAPNNGFLESTIAYKDSSYRWLGGVQDDDVPGDPQNWIRSGTYNDVGGSPSSNDWSMPTEPFDPSQNYEKIINGTWAPYLLCAYNDQNNIGPAYNVQTKTTANMEDLSSVDIVFTSDKTKWSRAVVVEMCRRSETF